MSRKLVNNAIYEKLGDAWYDSCDNPVALLRCEAKLKNPWVRAEIIKQLGIGSKRVLDVGCGAGFLSNDLARAGHVVTGLDASRSSLDVAEKFAPNYTANEKKTGSANYILGDAYFLPFEENTFDVVCAMDFLEHVEDPARVIAEASRVLKPGGLLFFHTFSRNWLSWVVIIKLLEWFVRGTPADLHVYRLFINPNELQTDCERSGLSIFSLKGIRPKFVTIAALRVLFTGRVAPEFEFTFTRSLRLGYLGIARTNVARVCS